METLHRHLHPHPPCSYTNQLCGGNSYLSIWSLSSWICKEGVGHLHILTVCPKGEMRYVYPSFRVYITLVAFLQIVCTWRVGNASYVPLYPSTPTACSVTSWREGTLCRVVYWCISVPGTVPGVVWAWRQCWFSECMNACVLHRDSTHGTWGLSTNLLT